MKVFDNKGNLTIQKATKQNKKQVLKKLKSIGKISNSTNCQVVFDNLYSTDENILLVVIKNLGKLKDKKYIKYFKKVIRTNESSLVRREAVSSLGRLRDRVQIEYFIKLLKDEDPNIVLQSIRALLIFKKTPRVKKALKKMKKHENEIVRQVISNELADETHNSGKCASKDFFINSIINGDSREILEFIPNNVIDMTFTSPPYYNARDYSIYKSYKEYLELLCGIFKQLMNKTKEGGFLIVNTSPVIVPRFSRSYSSKRYPIPFDLNYLLCEMGWEFIDDIVWVKPEYSVKNRIGGFIQHRKPMAYKPNTVTEYLMVYRNRTNKLIDWSINQYNENIIAESKVDDDYEKTNVWHVSPSSDKVHSAIFPEDLCNKVISYYSFVGDLVFDPFGGVATLAKSARSNDRNYMIIEKEQKYFEEIKNRLPEAKIITLKELKNGNFKNRDV